MNRGSRIRHWRCIRKARRSAINASFSRRTHANKASSRLSTRRTRQSACLNLLESVERVSEGGPLLEGQSTVRQDKNAAAG